MIHRKFFGLCRAAKVAMVLLLAVVPNFFLESCCCGAQAICCCKAEVSDSGATCGDDSCCQTEPESKSSCFGDRNCSDSQTSDSSNANDDETASDEGCENCQDSGLRVEPYEPQILPVQVAISDEPLFVFLQSRADTSIDHRSDALPQAHQQRQALLGVWIE
ncbi:MAG: hypothetical protein AAF483_27280 [Planctomycetota bacterium]